MANFNNHCLQDATSRLNFTDKLQKYNGEEDVRTAIFSHSGIFEESILSPSMSRSTTDREPSSAHRHTFLRKTRWKHRLFCGMMDTCTYDSTNKSNSLTTSLRLHRNVGFHCKTAIPAIRLLMKRQTIHYILNRHSQELWNLWQILGTHLANVGNSKFRNFGKMSLNNRRLFSTFYLPQRIFCITKFDTHFLKKWQWEPMQLVLIMVFAVSPQKWTW